MEEREQFEEAYRERTAPGLHNLIMNAVDDLPIRFAHLRSLNEAIEGLEEMLEPCDCGQPDCLAAPQHREKYITRLAPALEKLKEARDEVLEACIDMDWKVSNCDCSACQLRARQRVSWLN